MTLQTSYFANGITDKSPKSVATLAQIIDSVKGGTWAGKVNQLRTIEYGTDAYKAAKNKLPYITPHCTIKGERANVNADTLSGVLCFDLDYGDNKNVALDELKTQMVGNSYIYSFFDSPSEKGLKFFVKAQYDKENFSRAYKYTLMYFQQIFGIRLDVKQGNLSQACYVSFDKQAYKNEASEVFIPVLIEQSEIVGEAQHHTGDVYTLVKTILEKKAIMFEQGNKHRYLLHFASLCNKFGVSKNDCINYINNSIENGVIKTNCIEGGYQDTSLHGTMKFEAAKVKQVEISRIANIQSPTKDVLDKDATISQLLSYYDSGWPMAQTTGVEYLDNNLRFQKGWLYLLYGIASMGKSAFSRFLFMSSAKAHGNKFAIYAFEETGLSYVNKLAQVYLAQNTMSKYSGRCTKEDYKTALLFVMDHFFFVYPETDFSLKNIEDNFKRLHDKHGLFGVCFDPLNQVELPSFPNIAEQWKDFYMKRKIFAVKNDLMYFNTAHPIKQFSQDGDYPMPDWQNIDGGAMHGNKNDVVICYHRPFFISNPKDALCYVKVWKVKDHDTAGMPGTIEVSFDRSTGHYKKYTGTPTI